ncbi:hypothetical protein [Cryptosporangium phraense]|uniref:Uncharacterized protein n=1 Tax=Cryptosporangium phraense TaxID=2593070 RepID=A0A545AX21_9ACTN|nr:hypothetical protein [Cryptosporangium phraense]TQS45887.1 hypothetical protein FL583_05120 [Cryptosporangium phraense]
MLDLINDWSALPLQLIGLGIAIWQIRKAFAEASAARAAAERAEQAAKNTQVSLMRNHLLILIPQLQRAESDIEWAIGRADPDSIIHHLGVWRWQASQLKGMAGAAIRRDPGLETSIDDSLDAAALAKVALQNHSGDVAKKTRGVQLSIAAVTKRIGELAAQISADGRGHTPDAAALEALAEVRRGFRDDDRSI